MAVRNGPAILPVDLSPWLLMYRIGYLNLIDKVDLGEHHTIEILWLELLLTKREHSLRSGSYQESVLRTRPVNYNGRRKTPWCGTCSSSTVQPVPIMASLTSSSMSALRAARYGRCHSISTRLAFYASDAWPLRRFVLIVRSFKFRKSFQFPCAEPFEDVRACDS
jgi:hypothetical protein